MLKAIKILLYIPFISLLSCQDISLTSTAFLNIKMIGSLVAPESATGNNEPKWQEYSLEGVFIGPDPESGDALSLYNDDPVAYKIINRSQIIYKKEIPEAWVGETFTSLVMRFSTEVKTAGQYGDDYELVLDESDIGYYDSFLIEKGQGITATINVQWKNTNIRNDDDKSETWTLPSFLVEVKTQ